MSLLTLLEYHITFGKQHDDMKKREYVVLQTSNGIEYFIDYSAVKGVYRREYNGRYAKKYTYDGARYARGKYMENYPQEPEPALSSVW